MTFVKVGKAGREQYNNFDVAKSVRCDFALLCAKDDTIPSNNWIYTTVYSPIILLPAVAAEVNQVVDVAAPDGVGAGRVPVGVEDDVDGAVPVRQETVLAVPLLAPLLVLGVARHEVPHQDGVQRVAAVSLLKRENWG